MWSTWGSSSHHPTVALPPTYSHLTPRGHQQGGGGFPGRRLLSCPAAPSSAPSYCPSPPALSPHLPLSSVKGQKDLAAATHSSHLQKRNSFAFLERDGALLWALVTPGGREGKIQAVESRKLEGSICHLCPGVSTDTVHNGVHRG